MLYWKFEIYKGGGFVDRTRTTEGVGPGEQGRAACGIILLGVVFTSGEVFFPLEEVDDGISTPGLKAASTENRLETDIFDMDSRSIEAEFFFSGKSMSDALLCFFFPGCLFDGTLSGIFAEFDVGSEFSDDMEPMEWSKGF